jgi:SAM-dependent methyltransferase
MAGTSGRSGLKQQLGYNFGKVFPEAFYFIQYYRGMRKLGNSDEIQQHLFKEMLQNASDKKCLQIGVKEDYGAKFGPNWESVDLFDMRDFIDYHYDIHDLKFEDERYDVVVCMSVLEHVPFPAKAISELHRVLKTGGLIWVQLPFAFPYHESPQDYWRVSPDGLRIWMADFEEISCGSFLWTRTALVSSTYFYGTKKPLDSPI